MSKKPADSTFNGVIVFILCICLLLFFIGIFVSSVRIPFMCIFGGLCIPLIYILLKSEKKEEPGQFTEAVPKKQTHSRRANTALENIEGFAVRYMYEDVDVCVWDSIIPPGTKPDNRIALIQEKDNKADPNAVLLLLVPQKKKLGYIYRGKKQDMINDFLNRGDKVTARICSISQHPTTVQIDLAFYLKINNKQ